MNGPSLARPAFFSLALSLAAFLIATGLPIGAFAQDPEPEDDPAPSAEGQAVDEEEAEFRRRMELEESDEGELSGDVDLPDIVEVDPDEGPEGALPPQSRDHIEEQLTKLIIENGRWEPEDAERPAPYTPSEAAQQDPELAEREQEVWDEQVAAYHERERAAWEQAGGQSGGSTGQGTGQGAGNGAGSGSGSGSGAGAAGGQAGEPSPGGVAGSEERPPEGEPFSALEFLGGAPAAEGEAPEAAGSTGEAAAPPVNPPAGSGDGATGSGSSEATDTAAASDPVPGTEGQADGVTPDDGSGPEAADTGADETDGADSGGFPPGVTPGETVDAAASSSGASAENPGSPPAEEGPPPGSVPTEAFEGMFEPGSSTDEAEPSVNERAADRGEPSEGAPVGSATPPSPPSFLDWLFSLFGGDEAPEAEPDDGEEDSAQDPVQR